MCNASKKRYATNFHAWLIISTSSGCSNWMTYILRSHVGCVQGVRLTTFEHRVKLESIELQNQRWINTFYYLPDASEWNPPHSSHYFKKDKKYSRKTHGLSENNFILNKIEEIISRIKSWRHEIKKHLTRKPGQRLVWRDSRSTYRNLVSG